MCEYKKTWVAENLRTKKKCTGLRKIIWNPVGICKQAKFRIVLQSPICIMRLALLEMDHIFSQINMQDPHLIISSLSWYKWNGMPSIKNKIHDVYPSETI